MNKRLIGGEMEKRIRDYMGNNGYRVVEMNYRCKQGEIDIIADDGNYLCFVEVKYRHDTTHGYPEEAVDIRKQHRICNAARYYMYSHGMNEYTPVRLDVASILNDDIRYIENAFDWVV